MKISLIQTDIFWADIQSNLRKTEKDLASLSGKTDLAVLPEMFSTGFCTDRLDLAETMDVQCMMGCMLECKVGITAAASLAAGKKIITRTDLDAAVLLAEDPVLGGVSFTGNRLCVSELPGLGISDVVGWARIDA